MKKLVSILFVSIAGLGLSSAALAEDEAKQAQVGISAGESEFENIDDKGSSLQVWYGRQRDENWSWEIGYTDSGEADLVGGGQAKADGFTGSLLYNKVLGEKVTGYLRGGVFFWTTEVTGQPEDDGNDFYYGVGLRYNYSEKVNLRAEFNAYSLDGDRTDTDLDVINVGLEYALDN